MGADYEPTAALTPPAGVTPSECEESLRRPIEQSGAFIGPYRLLHVIGEGGFGIVWLAERREPMVQRVAIKVVKPGMDSRSVIARFEQERQALALMDHPNVARILDGGLTPAHMGSRPYFVMEHVKGELITAFCEHHRLSISERLELFIPVCEAIQHAHMKGVIHRDLKPSNILVTLGDTPSGSTAGAHGTPPIPKVIDFGVAKAMVRSLTDKTIHTELGQLIGTPEYMSPEQAELGELDIDTRTDVYSLGVVLYELLCGLLPFEPDDLRRGGLAAAQRVIRDVEPLSPSRRLLALHAAERGKGPGRAEQATATGRIADARRAPVSEIARTLRRELEWIVLRAMRKERRFRYQSAAELAGDIQNYLANRPLMAGPESVTYSLAKSLRRHRGAAILGSATIGLVLAGLGVAAWQASRAQDARRVAESRTSNLLDMLRDEAARVLDDYQRNVLGNAGPETAAQAKFEIRRRIDDAWEACREKLVFVEPTGTDFAQFIASEPTFAPARADMLRIRMVIDRLRRLRLMAGARDDAMRLLLEDEALRAVGLDPRSEADPWKAAETKLCAEFRPELASAEQFEASLDELWRIEFGR